MSLRNYLKNHVDVAGDDGVQWRFTGIYGESQTELKYKTWNRLRDLYSQSTQPGQPWLVAGDFNEILHQFEKEGGRPRPQAQIDRFRCALEDCELSDIGFAGDIFTWRNNQFREADFVRERIDRAVANTAWRSKFSGMHVINGDPYHSDHRPVIIDTDRNVRMPSNMVGQRPFKFEASWLEEERCKQIVSNVWEVGGPDGGVLQKLREVASSLLLWNTNVLGSLEKRLKRAKKELEAYRRMPISNFF